MRQALLIALLTVCSYPSPAAPVRLEGEPFRPELPIAWAATNRWPDHVSIYRLAPSSLSQAALSNAMVIGSFKPINRVRSGDKNMLLFQDNPDRTYMKRYLKAVPSQGFLEYYDAKADSGSGVGVPAFGDVEKLAMQYLWRFGVNTNQVTRKDHRLLDEQTSTMFDHKGGKQISKLVTRRGVSLFRQLDGIRDQTSSFWIDFANDAKPTAFRLEWPALEPVKRYRTATQAELLEWLKKGLAVKVEPPFEGASLPVGDAPKHIPTALTIVKVELFYSKPLGPSRDLVPCAQLQINPDASATNAPSFSVWCPIIDSGRD